MPGVCVDAFYSDSSKGFSTYLYIYSLVVGFKKKLRRRLSMVLFILLMVSRTTYKIIL